MERRVEPPLLPLPPRKGRKWKERRKGEEIMEEVRGGNVVWTLADSVFIFSCRRPPTGADPPDGRAVGPRRARTRPTGTKSAAAASPPFPTAAAASPPFPKGLWEGAEPPPHFPKRCGNYNQGLRPGGPQWGETAFKVSTGAPSGRLRDGANPSGGPSPVALWGSGTGRPTGGKPVKITIFYLRNYFRSDLKI